MTDSDGYRVIAPGYVITTDGEIWSQARPSKGKGGSVRQLQPRKLKPDDGRVSLSVDGVVERVSVTDVFKQFWPDIVACEKMIERNCRKGHPLTPGNVIVWGSGNRICRSCNPDLTQDDVTPQINFPPHTRVEGLKSTQAETA